LPGLAQGKSLSHMHEVCVLFRPPCGFGALGQQLYARTPTIKFHDAEMWLFQIAEAANEGSEVV
jgi:hypothetical protein